MILSTIIGYAVDFLAKNAIKLAELSYKIRNDNHKIDRSQFYRLAVCIAILNRDNDNYYDERIKKIIENAKKKEKNFEDKYLRKYSVIETWNKDQIRNIANIIFTEKSIISYNNKFKKISLDKLKIFYLNDFLLLNSLIVELKTSESGKDIFSRIYQKSNSVNKEKDISLLENERHIKSKELIEETLLNMKGETNIDQYKVQVIIQELESLPNEKCLEKGEVKTYSQLLLLVQNKKRIIDKIQTKSKDTLFDEIISSYLKKLELSSKPRYFITFVYNSLFSSLGCYLCNQIFKKIFVEKNIYMKYYEDIKIDRLSIIEKIFFKFEEKINSALDKKIKLQWEENFVLWKKTVPVEIIAKMF